MRYLTVLGALSLAVIAAPAAALDEVDLFLARGVEADILEPGGLGVVRSRAVAIDFQALPGADGASALPPAGHRLRLNLFDGVALSTRMTRARGLGRGLSWSGQVDADPLSSVEIVVFDGVVSGSVNAEAGSYRIGWDGGGQVVEEMDYSQFPEGHDCALHPPNVPHLDQAPQAALDDGSTIDVMVVYTPAARAAQGGQAAMESLINLAIAETNTAYSNSSVIQRLRLVHTAEVSLTESDIRTDLDRVTDTDGYIDNVQTLRETYKADLVSLFGEGYTVSDGACGIAWLMAGNNPGFASAAYSVVDRTCATGYYSFGHEIGHNQGLNHARVDPVGTGAFDYSYGYKDPGNLFRTTMAYNCPISCTRRPYYSNPNVLYSGQPTGIIDTAPDSAYNAKSLDGTRVTVANWRTRTPAVTVTSPNGGESWLVGSSHAITWTSSELDPSATVTLTYSDGVTTYPIASGIDPYATPSFDWTIPNNPGTTFTVTVCSDLGGPCEASDASDADFAITTVVHTLSVSRDGLGTGSVTSSPAGIDCGLDCSEDYPAGTPVTLTAAPDTGYVFAGWSGACSGTSPSCLVTMNAPASATASFDIPGEAVSWERLIGTEVVGPTLRRPSGWGWDAGAVSSKVLLSGVGYAEYQVTSSSTYLMFGLSQGDSDATWTDIDYPVYTHPGTGQLVVYWKGAPRGAVGAYSAGDRLRVSVEGGFVRLRQNGLLLYTWAEVPTYPLLVDTSLYSSGAEVFDAVIGGTLGSRASLASTDVRWRDAVNVNPVGSTLHRASFAGWNAGAASVQELASGDGFAEYRVSDLGSYVMFGLSNGDTDQGYGDIDFAIYTYPPTAQAFVFENGTYRANLGTYQVGDMLRVAVEGGAVLYWINEVLLHYSSTAPTYPLLADASLYSANAVLADATMGGELREVVAWTHLTEVDVQDDALERVGPAGWTAGATSNRRIASGDGAAEHTVADLATYLMFGLSKGNTDVAYEDIDFALYTYPASTALMVYEGGTYRGTFGTYNVGDRLEVSVETGAVKYWRNDTLLYTSAVPPQYPLRIDASLHSGRIEGARLSGNLESLPIVEETVSWTSLVGVNDNAGTLERLTGVGWNAGAVSAQTLTGEGYVEFEVADTASYQMCGLGNGDASQSWTDIEYAIYTYPVTGELLVFEAGTYRATGGVYAAGDRLRVAVEGGVVKYRKNGLLIHTSTVAPAFPLNVDTSLYSTGASIVGAVIGREE